MSTDLGPDFFEKYNAINGKLKKRFMRKPNATEATDEFCELALQCEHAEQLPHAGLCYVGAAGCEATAGNLDGEAEHLLMAARQFAAAEHKLSSLRCLSPGEENLEAALSCYGQVAKRFRDNSCIVSSTYLEVADNLERLNRLHEAEKYYQAAMINFPNKPGHTLMCLLHLSRMFIKQAKYAEALNTYNKIDEIAREHNYNLYLQRSEVCRLLLYLIVRPSPKTISDSLERLLERYRIDCDLEDVKLEDLPVNPELALHLRSVLAACNIGDVQILTELRTEMKNFLDVEQQDLMRVLIETYESMK